MSTMEKLASGREIESAPTAGSVSAICSSGVTLAVTADIGLLFLCHLVPPMVFSSSPEGGRGEPVFDCKHHRIASGLAKGTYMGVGLAQESNGPIPNKNANKAR